MNVIIDEMSFSKMNEQTSEFYMKHLGMYDAEPVIGNVGIIDTNVIPVTEYDELYLEDGQEMTYEEYSAKMEFICQVLHREENELMSLLPVHEFKEVFIDRDYDGEGPLSHAFGSMDFHEKFPRPKWSPFKAEKKELFEKLHNLVLMCTCVSDEAGKKELKDRIRRTCQAIKMLKKQRRKWVAPFILPIINQEIYEV